MQFLFLSDAFAQDVTDAAPPLTMSNSLSFCLNFFRLIPCADSNFFIYGISTGLSFLQSNPVLTNSSAYSGLSNA